MTTTTDQVDPDYGDESGDSPVIRDLRNQLKAEQRARKEAEAANEAAVEKARAQVAREFSAERLLVDAGFPSQKIRDMYLREVEGDPTEDSVTSFLTELGVSSKAPEVQPDSRAEKVAGVANLSQQVASAASGTDTSSLEKRIAAANSPAEVEAIMAENQLLQ